MMKYQLHLNEEKCLEILSLVTGFQPSCKDCWFCHDDFYWFFRFHMSCDTYMCYIVECDKTPFLRLETLYSRRSVQYDLNVFWMLLHDMLREVAA